MKIKTFFAIFGGFSVEDACLLAEKPRGLLWALQHGNREYQRDCLDPADCGNYTAEYLAMHGEEAVEEHYGLIFKTVTGLGACRYFELPAPVAIGSVSASVGEDKLYE